MQGCAVVLSTKSPMIKQHNLQRGISISHVLRDVQGTDTTILHDSKQIHKFCYAILAQHVKRNSGKEDLCIYSERTIIPQYFSVVLKSCKTEFVIYEYRYTVNGE
jgi:hypothetical protein